MMRAKYFHLSLFLLVLSFNLVGQDLHYSYYQFTPLDVNPANTGAFSGSYRVNGIYTQKGSEIAGNGYKNFSLSADAPIVRGIRKQDWIGVGVIADVINSANGSGNIFVDPNAANQNAQTWSFFKISAAYHLALDKKQTNIVTLGAQLSNATRLLNFSKLDSRAFAITGFDSDFEEYKKQFNTNGDTKFKSRDISVGLLFNARRKTSDLRLGFSVEGILGSNVGSNSNSTLDFPADSVETKFFGLNIHGEYKMDINKRTSITPGFYYYSLGPANAFNVNTHAWYQVNPDMDFKAGLGLGVRNLRDVIIYLGAQMNDIQVGFSYDLNIDSRVVGSNGLGGFELCARYIGKIYKKPKVKPIIFCPRL